MTYDDYEKKHALLYADYTAKLALNHIQIIQNWRITCEDCSFGTKAESAGKAENLAKEHIENENGKGAEPNFSHTVEIALITLVGREL
jgi:hypothetical protein